MNFENMNSALILLMLGFAAIMVMFIFVMHSLDNLAKNLREERRVLIGNLDNLSQDIRSIKMRLDQGSSGNQAATANPPLNTSQLAHNNHNNMIGASPGGKPPVPASGRNAPGPGLENPVSGPLSGQSPGLSVNATAPSTAAGADKAADDDFFLDLSLQDPPEPRQKRSSGTKQPGLQLKF